MNATTKLDEIAVFVHVVEAGSFAEAARQRGVPKSTLSRAVVRLEDAMRARLIRRTARKVSLTEAGRVLFDRAAPHVAGLRDATAVMGDCGDEPRGTLRITAPVDAGDAFLAEMMVRFAARYPLLRVEVDLSARMVNLVEEGFDAAIRAAPRIEDPNVVARKVLRTEGLLFASPAYLARRGAPEAPGDLPDHDCVLFRPVDGKVEWRLHGPGGDQPVTVTGRLAGNDLTFIHAAVRAGGGVGVLPNFVAARDVAEGRLVRVLAGWTQPQGTVFIVYPAARHVPKKVLVFRDFVVESFKQIELRGA
jgi:DNA-binding transcriptional LysR family regulator